MLGLRDIDNELPRFYSAGIFVQFFTCMSSLISCTWYTTNLWFNMPLQFTIFSKAIFANRTSVILFFLHARIKIFLSFLFDYQISFHIGHNFQTFQFCVKVSSLRVLLVCNSNSFLGHDLLRIRSG